MISAKLMKELEKKGFDLAFPSYGAEDAIIEILKQDGERLKIAIPLLMQEEFDYDYLKEMLTKEQLSKLNKVIMIANEIFKKEGINSKHLTKIIFIHRLKGAIDESEFAHYYDSFKESTMRKDKSKSQQMKARNKITLNKSLSEIFSPGKMSIMNKITNHETLTNTELKYYYRSIRPIINSILDEDIKEYVKLIENTKKEHR